MTSLRHTPQFEEGVEKEPKDAYLDAARDCILDVGWRRTTLTEVARRAGVSRMTIYRTWADMPTLLGDLMTREWAGVVTEQVTNGGPAIQRIADAIVGTVRQLRMNELFVRIVELDPELILPYLFTRRGRSQVRRMTALVTSGGGWNDPLPTLKSLSVRNAARTNTVSAPYSFTPRSRLMADMMSPPANPILVSTNAITAASPGEKGVAHHSPAPIAVAHATPPTYPAHVLFGLTDGAIGRRPMDLPQTYCSTSLNCTTSTRKNSSFAFCTSYPGMRSMSSAGT
jgi:AcrR family transcriptional regulator